MEVAELRFQNVQELERKDLLGQADRSVKAFIEESSFLASDLWWFRQMEIATLPIDARFASGLVNLQRLNDLPRINKYLESANQFLGKGKLLVLNMETKNARKIRILNKFPRFISFPYYCIDFVVKRIFPKWEPTKRIYFWLTKGRNRVMSLTECLGRLYSCGFEVLNYQQVGYTTWIIARKTGEPVYDMQPTYGPLCYLKRVGKDGKLFTVYKFRTMHPYSEYLQNYAFQRNSLQNGGKIKDDFRITSWGRIFRKLWIDELPMLYNWLKGDMKLVGVRPLSRHYFSLYPEHVQELRTQFKPGLIPPFYADLPETLEEIVESERIYLEAYKQSPLRTDLRYFFKALNNILIKRARSK